MGVDAGRCRVYRGEVMFLGGTLRGGGQHGYKGGGGGGGDKCPTHPKPRQTAIH